MVRVSQRVLYKGWGQTRARLELAAGTGDGRRPRDGAGYRRGLAAAHGLNLQCVVLDLVLKRVSAASFKKSEAREVRIFVRHCNTRQHCLNRYLGGWFLQ